MSVNQARHQHTPARRNNSNVGNRINGDWACGYALNGAAFDQHIGRS
jgi:hypothetical protein